jgi:hypothetical protein
VKVQIKGDISGSRDGVPWPKRGETMELPDDEGAALCASGLAVPAAETDDEVETAVPADDSEERADGLTKETAEALTGDAAQPAKPVQPAKKTAAKRTAAKPAEGK